VPGRWLALWPHAPCPAPLAVGDFITSSLFAEGGPDVLLPPELQGFCVYDRITGPVPGDPPPAFTSPPLGLSRDRWVIAPFGARVSVPDMGAELRAAVLERTGSTVSSGLANLARPPVRVAVVDGAVDRLGAAGRAGLGVADHGHSVGRIIRELSCPPDMPGPGCFSFIGNELALRYNASGTASDKGGEYGSLADLARAIDAAVDHWEGDPAHPPHLIVNLSVGWDGQYGSDPDDASVPPVVAVHRALRRATCAGALVVAAAGNHTAGSSGGPLHPAAWQSTATGSCGGVLLPGEPTQPSFAAQPLVWAVGGVDAAGAPLYNHRAGARPPLVAYGYAASVRDDIGQGNFTDELTGTSASAAVVSGTAAVLWALEPALSPRQVIDRIYLSGAAVDATADFCEPGSCASRPVRRAMLCGALTETKVCAFPWFCLRPFSCEAGATRPRANVRLPSTTPATAGSLLQPVSVDYRARKVRIPVLGTPPAMVGGSLTLSAASPPPDCAVEPWVCPQPEPVHCSPCFVDVGSFGMDLFMNLSSSEGITSAQLQLDGQSFGIAVPTAPAAAGTTSAPPAYVVRSIPYSGTAQQATLTITRTDIQSTQQVLIVR
jgi:hypothetical protein